jgi:lipopolysaccharide/colanic/teichoic acid biosynthesis glycosyltransferase
VLEVRERVRASAPLLPAPASPKIAGRRRVPQSWWRAKRAIDVALGAVGFVVSAPIVALAAVAIVCVSPGSPIFAQERVGQNGRRFRIYKLRTMVDGAHLRHDELRPYSDVSGPVFKMRNDPRLHLFGRVLRRTSIDELPNLVNVLRGEMSLVGPRPPLPSEVAHYDEFSGRRLSVKPGITCLWQVCGRSNVPVDEWMRLDNDYIDGWSPLGDLAIIARTVPAVIRGDGAH